jgi:hypothetical protein
MSSLKTLIFKSSNGQIKNPKKIIKTVVKTINVFPDVNLLCIFFHGSTVGPKSSSSIYFSSVVIFRLFFTFSGLIPAFSSNKYFKPTGNIFLYSFVTFFQQTGRKLQKVSCWNFEFI